jgi:hypothetical protein
MDDPPRAFSHATGIRGGRVGTSQYDIDAVSRGGGKREKRGDTGLE